MGSPYVNRKCRGSATIAIEAMVSSAKRMLVVVSFMVSLLELLIDDTEKIKGTS